jgi:hypothetical protein
MFNFQQLKDRPFVIPSFESGYDFSMSNMGLVSKASTFLSLSLIE